MTSDPLLSLLQMHAACDVYPEALHLIADIVGLVHSPATGLDEFGDDASGVRDRVAAALRGEPDPLRVYGMADYVIDYTLPESDRTRARIRHYRNQLSRADHVV